MHGILRTYDQDWSEVEDLLDDVDDNDSIEYQWYE